MHILYRLTFASGKSYIGQTVRTMNTRIGQHRRSAVNGKSLLPVHCAWRKYGEPLIEVIGEFDSPESLHKAEIDAIRDQSTLAPEGYNVGIGGETAPSKSPSVKAKISATSKGRVHSIEVKAFIAENSKNNWTNDEYREKVSSGLKASWTDEMRKAAGERSKARWEKRKLDGWVMPDSQKDKLKAKIVSEETRAKMSAAAKGKKKAPRSQATKDKLSESTKRAWQDKELSARRVRSIKSAWTDEARGKMSEKAADTWRDPEVRDRRIAAMKASSATTDTEF